MTVISVTARGIGCSGKASQGIGQTGGDAQVSKTYRAHYRAKADPLDSSPIIYQYLEANSGNGGIPWFGSILTLGNGSDSAVVCQDIDVDPIEGGPGLFDIIATFKPANSEGDIQQQPGSGGSLSANPLDWLDDIDVSFTQTSVAVERGIFHGFFDDEGNPANAQLAIGSKLAIANSAGVPYDPPIEDEKQIKIIRIARNVFEYDDFLLDDFNGAINSDEFIIEKPFYRFRSRVRPLTALCRLGSVFNIQNGIKYYRQTLELWIDKENWRRKILDKGQQRMIKEGAPNGTGSSYSSADIPDEGNAPYVQLADPDGLPLSSPVGFGGGGFPKNNALGPSFYGHWGIKDERAFAPLAGVAW